MLLWSLLNGMILHSASSSTALTCRMLARNTKGTIQGLMAKTRAPKMVNRTRAVQIVFLPVKTASRITNFLSNISFSKNWAIKLLIAGEKPA